MFNKKIAELKNFFGIFTPEDWQSVSPDMILRRDGIGQGILNYIRLLLAQRELTLRGDRTPEFWKKHLKEVKIGHTLGDEDDGEDRGELFPWTVWIDSAEQQPFSFQGFGAEFSQDNPPWIVPVETIALGRHPESLGDYTLDCCRGRCHVERKSKEDAYGTILGFRRRGEETGRRERFECELQNLANIDAGLVVVECSLGELIGDAPDTPRKTAAENAVTLERSIFAFQQDYRVPWLFCETRRQAERATLYWLARYARGQEKQRKVAERESLVSPGQRRQKELYQGI